MPVKFRSDTIILTSNLAASNLHEILQYYLLPLAEWRSRSMCSFHDDVIKWKHFPRNWPFVWGIHRSRWIPRTKASDAELWCFFYLRLNKRLSKQSWGWWFQTPPWPLWRHCNVNGPSLTITPILWCHFFQWQCIINKLNYNLWGVIYVCSATALVKVLINEKLPPKPMVTTISWLLNIDTNTCLRMRWRNIETAIHNWGNYRLTLSDIVETIMKMRTPWSTVLKIPKSSNTFSATNISSNIVWFLQLHDTIRMKSIYT